MEIILTRQFKDDIKFYKRRKKYLKIDADVRPVIDELQAGNFIGDKLDNINLPNNSAVYKVRVANTSTRSGKSNGFRLIYYLKVEEKIYLVTIYSKKDDNRIPMDAQIAELINGLL